MFDLFSNIKWVNSQAFFLGEPLKHVITQMWAIHGKQKIVDKRFNMCARGAGTHGDVLNVHTVTC